MLTCVADASPPAADFSACDFAPSPCARDAGAKRLVRQANAKAAQAKAASVAEILRPRARCFVSLPVNLCVMLAPDGWPRHKARLVPPARTNLWRPRALSSGGLRGVGWTDARARFEPARA